LRKKPKKRSPNTPARRAKPSTRTEASPKKAPRGKYYPAFIDLRDKPCVVVGGGTVAERKALSLLDAGAKVTVVSPTLTEKLRKAQSSGGIKHTKRRFSPSDLRGTYLVIVATDSLEENIKISGAANIMGTPLINVVDMPEHCNFIVPASVRRGPLTISVSTAGASPAMAREIRKELEGLYGAAFGNYIKELQRKREHALLSIKDDAERTRFFNSLASDKILKMLREGKTPEVKVPEKQAGDKPARKKRRKRPRRKPGGKPKSEARNT
jgi:precorrin-2 dehydrogenase/sirohydrochlorin ferrochelatase